jgi:hypothetical protein
MRNRNEIDPSAPDRGMGGMLIGALAIIVVLALVYVWAPWSGNRAADNTPAGTTVGQGSAPHAESQQTAGTAAPSTDR